MVTILYTENNLYYFILPFIHDDAFVEHTEKDQEQKYGIKMGY